MQEKQALLSDSRAASPASYALSLHSLSFPRIPTLPCKESRIPSS